MNHSYLLVEFNFPSLILYFSEFFEFYNELVLFFKSDLKNYILYVTHKNLESIC